VEESKIKEFLQRRTYWYHKIRLADGIVTPGFDLEPLWDQVRKVRDTVDYKGKTVLDIASFDGMFAFEAEKRGANRVIATDCLYKSFENFLFCREVLQSSVFPYYNVSPYNLTDRLNVYFQENYEELPEDRRFDIVQHFGLLYHLRDPMLSLLQARSVLKPGGILILETDFIMDSNESKMVFNGLPENARVRDNYSVWWAPTKLCLLEMLQASLFQPNHSSVAEMFFDVPGRENGRVLAPQNKKKSQPEYKIGRICLTAKAVATKEAQPKLLAELKRTYRNPGLDEQLYFFF
jgi:SAM-dependent methyltransferase